MSSEAIEPVLEGAAAYLEGLHARLVSDGFRVSLSPNQPFELTGLRSGFELTKFGNVDTFVAVIRRGSIRRPEVESLAATALAAAKAAPRGFRMPRGFGQALFCHVLFVVDSASPDTVEAIERQAAPKHMAVFESRSVFDLSTGRLHVFEGTVVWGAAYLAGQRALLKRLFGTSG